MDQTSFNRSPQAGPDSGRAVSISRIKRHTLIRAELPKFITLGKYNISGEWSEVEIFGQGAVNWEREKSPFEREGEEGSPRNISLPRRTAIFGASLANSYG